jgi:hypothetical protein
MASVECLQEAVRMLVACRQALRAATSSSRTVWSSRAGNGSSPMR